jgi:hypothetical protein
MTPGERRKIAHTRMWERRCKIVRERVRLENERLAAEHRVSHQHPDGRVAVVAHPNCEPWLVRMVGKLTNFI